MTAHLPVAKLEKLVPILGSPVDGEALGAARAIGRTLEASGATRHDLSAAVRRGIEQQDNEPARVWRPCATWQQAAVQCLRWPEALTEWEQNFIRDVSGRMQLSPKQADVLERIIWKAQTYAEASQ